MPAPQVNPGSITASNELCRLLERIAVGDYLSFRSLYLTTSPQLLAVLIRLLLRRAIAEEVLQDVYISIWSRASSYDAQRGAPMAWMTQIARHAALDLLRRADYKDSNIPLG